MKCNKNCNECLVNNQLYRIAYFILAELEKDCEDDDVYNLIEGICPNLTVCPECRVDDFTHVAGCKIDKELRKNGGN